MSDVLGELLPLSMAIAVNPIAIIAILLTFQAENAKALSSSFMAGWVAGIATVVVAVTVLSTWLPDRDVDESAPISGTIQLVLGGVLVYLAYWQWHQRPGDDEEAALPSWMQSVTTMGVARGFGVAYLISTLNIKHIFIAASVGVTIGSANLSASSTALAVVVFVLLASSSATLPVVAHFLTGEAFDRRMNGVYHWLVANNATILSVILLVIGTSIIGQGIEAF